MVKIGIIGTAGRNTDIYQLNKNIYEKSIAAVKTICQNLDPKDITLISGGSAWMDHIAVSLYLNNYISKLELCLPCEWDYNNHQFKSIGSSTDWKINPAYYINYLHRRFSEKIGHNTLDDLEQAIKTCHVNIYDGFHSRNNEIAKCDWLIAFGLTNELSDGGTKYTYNLCKGGRIYINALCL
jgi:hypothetical protein